MARKTAAQKKAELEAASVDQDKVEMEEEMDHVIAGDDTPKAEVTEAAKDPMYDKIRVSIPVHLKIAGVAYPPGTHIIERHQLDTVLEMVKKKQRANLAIFTGNNFLVEKMVSGSLKVTQVEDLGATLNSKGLR